MSDMANFNNQSSHERYTYNMDPNYTNANMGSMDADDIYFHQPPSQVIFPSDTGHLDNNNVYAGVNTQQNSEYYGYSTTNDDLTDSNPPATHYHLPQTSGRIPPRFTRSNNAGMTTNATSHGYVVIIMNADISLERLLSIIQSCGRVERIYM